MKPFLVWKFNYKYEPVKPLKHPAIILPNHVTNWDPLLVGSAFPQMMYYVASDHLFRLGWVSKIIQFLVAPIPRVKSAADRQTVASIFKQIREGHNICIFPEGKHDLRRRNRGIAWNNSQTGQANRCRPGYLPYGRRIPYPAPLVQISQARLHDRLSRACLPSGRNQSHVRRGIDESIEDDLYTNAYEEQKGGEPIAFRGKILRKIWKPLSTSALPAENGRASKQGDIFFCSCGLKLKYTEYGLAEVHQSTKASLYHRAGMDKVAITPCSGTGRRTS
jgi:hypothetical protein